MTKYLGYVGAIKDGNFNSQVVEVEVSSSMEAVPQLQQEAKQKYPESEGWTNHGTSSYDGVVIKK